MCLLGLMASAGQADEMATEGAMIEDGMKESMDDHGIKKDDMSDSMGHGMQDNDMSGDDMDTPEPGTYDAQRTDY